MIGHGSRVLVLGACSALGKSLVRAGLALGANVLAADRLRTGLEELRAELGQHERLHVAEWEATHAAGTRQLVADVTREGPLAAAWLVAADGADLGAIGAVAQVVAGALDPNGPGRLVLLGEPGRGPELRRVVSAVGSQLIAETGPLDVEAGLRLSELLMLGHPPPLRAQPQAVHTLIVGDVHGCVRELDDLLVASGFMSGDQLVMVGDLVAKGPDTRGVLRRLRELGALAVRGNHDQRLVRQHAALQRGEPVPPLSPTHQAVVDVLDQEDWAQLQALPLWLQLGALDTIVVHGGRVPALALERHDPDLLMNMRTLDGQGLGSYRPDAGVLWGSQWQGPELIVFGHHAMQGLQLHPHAIGLDTACVYGGRLTGLWLPERRLVSVPAHAAYAPRD